MNIRFVGSTDQIERLARFLPGNQPIYPSRKEQNESRLYLNIDDRLVEEILSKLEQNQTLDIRQLQS